MADQLKSQANDLEPNRDLQEEHFADWIMTNIIAEIIFEELESAGINPTEENARLVYLDLLENSFYEAVNHSIEYLPAFSEQGAGLAPVRSEG